RWPAPQWMRLSGRSTARRLTPGAPVQNPSHPGRVLLQFEENPVFDAGESRFRCRSTAVGAKGSRTRTPSHPPRVLLRFEKNPVLVQENPDLDVGAPPPVRKGVKPEHLRTRGGCSYGSRRTRSWWRRSPSWMWEHRPRCERGSGVGGTPSVSKGRQARAPSHPGRVLLRFEKNPGLDVGESRFGCRSTALGAKGESSQSTFAPASGAPTVRGEPPVLM